MSHDDDLAEIIHDAYCAEAPGCARWADARSGHRRYYRDRASVIITRLEPQIGIANVRVAVRVILGELS